MTYETLLILIMERYNCNRNEAETIVDNAIKDNRQNDLIVYVRFC